MLLISERGKKPAFAWQMKIGMQISSKYLTHLINNCIKIESGDDKYIVQSHSVSGQPPISEDHTCVHCQTQARILTSQSDLPKSHANISSQTFLFAVTLMIKIISWQLTFHEKEKTAQHCLKHQEKKYKRELRSLGEKGGRGSQSSILYCSLVSICTDHI